MLSVNLVNQLGRHQACGCGPGTVLFTEGRWFDVNTLAVHGCKDILAHSGLSGPEWYNHEHIHPIVQQAVHRQGKEQGPRATVNNYVDVSVLG